MLTHMGHKFSEEEVEEILTAADVNGDGRLDYEGLLSYSTWIACYSHFSGVVREGLGVGTTYKNALPIPPVSVRPFPFVHDLVDAAL